MDFLRRHNRHASRRLINFIENHKHYEDIGGPESGPHLTCCYNHPDWVWHSIEASFGTLPADRAAANAELHFGPSEDEIEWLEWLGEATYEIERKLNATSWLQGSLAYANSFAARY